MKKILSVILAVVMIFAAMPMAFAKEDVLKFGEDGKFRILQINDFQDIDNTNVESLKFLNAVLDKYQPDLVVLVGDQIRDGISGASVERLKTAIYNQVIPMEERGIPFIFTFGNHDRDYINIFPMEEQAKYYRSFEYCYANADGADGGTYNTVIYGKDGVTPALNVYMMDTQHWNGTGTTSGVTAEQVQWYVDTSNSLKEINNGEVVPSLVFQHIPVKEIFKLLKVVPQDTPGALKSKFTNEYYVLDEDADWIGDRNVMRETPACEHPDKITGQYEAWVQQGDIIGAYFGHDHVNTFVGRTEDGIVLGYNGGFGFATYGDPGERYTRIYDFTEGDVENYTQQNIFYTEVVKEDVTPEPEPEIPDDDCACNCHKGGIAGFFWKIANFFNKLFGIKKKQLCGCGAEHW